MLNPVFDDIVVTSLTTGKFNRLVNGECKLEEATGGVTLVSDKTVEAACRNPSTCGDCTRNQ